MVVEDFGKIIFPNLKKLKEKNSTTNRIISFFKKIIYEKHIYIKKKPIP
jgi:hypothetical protein